MQAAALLHTCRTHLHRLSLADHARKHAAKSQEPLLSGVGGARLAWQPVDSRLSRWAGHWGKRFGCCFHARQAGRLSDRPTILPRQAFKACLNPIQTTPAHLGSAAAGTATIFDT